MGHSLDQRTKRSKQYLISMEHAKKREYALGSGGKRSYRKWSLRLLEQIRRNLKAILETESGDPVRRLH